MKRIRKVLQYTAGRDPRCICALKEEKWLPRLHPLQLMAENHFRI